MGRITIRDVAQACGVSASTVSNAYNQPTQLSEGLRRTILATAAELGYPGPSAAGRSLRSGKAGAIGVLLSQRVTYAFSDPYAIGFLVGVSEEAERAGLSVLLLSTTDQQGNPDIGAIQRANIDSLVTLCADDGGELLDHAGLRGIPVVASIAGQGSRTLLIDDEGGGRLMGQHLGALGHRDIAVLVGSSEKAGSDPRVATEEDINATDFRRRLAGIREAMPQARITLVTGGYNSFESGRVAVPTILALDPRPTAVIALSDVLALGAMWALRDAGIAVPEEISVMGFDDIDEAAHSQLTTIRQPIVERGRTAARMVIEPEAHPKDVVLPIELMVRESTGPAPA